MENEKVVCRVLPVDIENEFCYNNNTYEISPKLTQYEVKNYAFSANDKYNEKEWTNECAMDSIIVMHSGDKLKFFDENLKEVTKDIKLVK